MAESRRRLLSTLAGAAGLLALQPLLFGKQGQSRPLPKAVPYPNGHDPNSTGLEEPSSLDPKSIQQENQKKIRADVARLFEMASELKQEVDKTDATVTLPLSIVKKAQQIEKLAKEIKGLAKG